MGSGCRWMWLGDVWYRTGFNCPLECDCDPPVAPGTFIGQPETTECNCPEPTPVP